MNKFQVDYCRAYPKSGILDFNKPCKRCQFKNKIQCKEVECYDFCGYATPGCWEWCKKPYKS